MKRFLLGLFMVLYVLIVVFVFVACSASKDKLNNPSEEYVISCVNRVPGVLSIQSVTEENDPNGQLHKDGGYSSAVFFSYELVDQDDVVGFDLVDKGTDAGGCVEVYTTVDDANRRNEYLKSFDGTIIASGSHIVVGTVVVRTSNLLTASQQKTLESNIISALKGDYINLSNSQTSQITDDMLQNAVFAANRFISETDLEYVTPMYLRETLSDVYGYSDEVTELVIQHCEIDWIYQANKYTQNLLDYEEFMGKPAAWICPTDLESYLLEEEFASDIVNKAVLSIDWSVQTKKYLLHLSSVYGHFSRFLAKEYMADIMANEEGLNSLLENSGINWNNHALNMARRIWDERKDFGCYTGEDDPLIWEDIKKEMLELWEFTTSEIQYAFNNF